MTSSLIRIADKSKTKWRGSSTRQQMYTLTGCQRYLRMFSLLLLFVELNEQIQQPLRSPMTVMAALSTSTTDISASSPGYRLLLRSRSLEATNSISEEDPLPTTVVVGSNSPTQPPSTTSEVASSNNSSSIAAARRESARKAFRDEWNAILLGSISIFSFTTSFFLGLTIYLHVNKKEALKGNSSAARKVILPAYEPFLAYMAFESFLWLMFAVLLYVRAFYIRATVAHNILYGRIGALVGPIMLIYQRSVSLRSTVRAMCISVLLQAVTMLPPVLYCTQWTDLEDSKRSPWVKCSTFKLYARIPVIIVLVLMATAWKLPTRASPGSIRFFLWFSIAFLSLASVASVCYSFISVVTPESVRVPYGIGLASGALWLLYPTAVWKLLRADTDYWRGQGQRAAALITKLSRDDKKISEEMSNLTLQSFVDFNQSVLLDFAYLRISSPQALPTSTCRQGYDVLEGVILGKTKIAIKVSKVSEFLTDRELAESTREAIVTTRVAHPNVVKFIGISLVPPHVLILTEYHDLSLTTFLRRHSCNVIGTREPPPACDRNDLEAVSTTLAGRSGGPPKRNHIHGNLLLIFMLDAARAVARLHSEMPAVVHRDIAADNFYLVEDECGGGLRLKLSGFDHATQIQSVGSMHSGLRQVLVYDHAQYMAPEVFEERVDTSNARAADVYALAIVLWQLAMASHPSNRRPFGTSATVQIQRRVLSGERPPLVTLQSLLLNKLLTKMWDSSPSERPSAAQVVSALEMMQMEQLNGMAFQLHEFLTLTRSSEEGSPHPTTCSSEDVEGAEQTAEMMQDDVYFSVETPVGNPSPSSFLKPRLKEEERENFPRSSAAPCHPPREDPKSGRRRRRRRESRNGESEGVERTRPTFFSGADAVRSLRMMRFATTIPQAERLGLALQEAGYIHQEMHSAAFSSASNVHFVFGTQASHDVSNKEEGLDRNPYNSVVDGSRAGRPRRFQDNAEQRHVIASASLSAFDALHCDGGSSSSTTTDEATSHQTFSDMIDTANQEHFSLRLSEKLERVFSELITTAAVTCRCKALAQGLERSTKHGCRQQQGNLPSSFTSPSSFSSLPKAKGVGGRGGRDRPLTIERLNILSRTPYGTPSTSPFPAKAAIRGQSYVPDFLSVFSSNYYLSPRNDGGDIAIVMQMQKHEVIPEEEEFQSIFDPPPAIKVVGAAEKCSVYHHPPVTRGRNTDRDHQEAGNDSNSVHSKPSGVLLFTPT